MYNNTFRRYATCYHHHFMSHLYAIKPCINCNGYDHDKSFHLKKKYFIQCFMFQGRVQDTKLKDRQKRLVSSQPVSVRFFVWILWAGFKRNKNQQNFLLRVLPNQPPPPVIETRQTYDTIASNNGYRQKMASANSLTHSLSYPITPNLEMISHLKTFFQENIFKMNIPW